MRPLYVEGGRKVRVKLDGPSLVVEREGSAQRRFPLGRLSRVILCGHMQTDYAVFRACGAAGIPVGVLDATGEPFGFFLPWKARPSRADEMLEDFLARPDWQSRYSDWRRSEERRAILKALHAAGLPPHLAKPGTARQALLGRFSDPHSGVKLMEAWRSQTAIAAAKALTAAGFAPTSMAGRRPGLVLTADLTALLEWSHWQYARETMTAVTAWAEQVAGYEAFRTREEQRAAALVDRFCYWLGGTRWR